MKKKEELLSYLYLQKIQFEFKMSITSSVLKVFSELTWLVILMRPRLIRPSGWAKTFSLLQKFLFSSSKGKLVKRRFSGDFGKIWLIFFILLPKNFGALLRLLKCNAMCRDDWWMTFSVYLRKTRSKVNILSV